MVRYLRPSATIFRVNNLSDKQFEMEFKWAWSRSRDLFKFWEIIDNISEMVQDRDTVTTED